MRTHTGKIALVVNRVAKALPGGILQMIEGQGFDPIVEISEDGEVYDLEVSGRPIIEIGENAPLRAGIGKLMSSLGVWNPDSALPGQIRM